VPVPNIPRIRRYLILKPAVQECALVSYLHSFIKNLASLIIKGPVTGFPSKHTDVNHLHNTLTNCTNLGCFNVCHLRTPLTLHLDVINDCHRSFCFFISQTVDDVMMHEGTTTIWYLLLSRPLIISNS